MSKLNFNKSEEELRILVDTYHGEIRDTSYNPFEIKYVASEMLWDTSWDSLIYEPVLQVTFHDKDDDIEDTDQFLLCKDIMGFSREDNDENEFVQMYEMNTDEVENLFKLYITDFLNSSELATPIQIQEVYNYNSNIIDIMSSIKYFDRYDFDVLSLVYELTQNPIFLPQEIADLFII